MLINLFRSGLEPREIIYLLIIYIFALTLSFAIHEFMHAAVAVWLGDPTPRNMGRLTLNPLAHLDPFGTILLLTVGFGWGKPVMYNPSNLNRFKNHRAMNIMVHLAGVTGNFLVAIVSSILASLFYHLYLGCFTGAIYVLKAFCDLSPADPAFGRFPCARGVAALQTQIFSGLYAVPEIFTHDPHDHFLNGFSLKCFDIDPHYQYH